MRNHLSKIDISEICTEPSSQYEKIVKKTKGLQVNLSDPKTLLSKNIKTGKSVNFPIAKTCRPTETCKVMCYASREGRPVTWNRTLIKQIQTYQYFLRTPVEVLANRILKESKERKWLRWCGTGDLFDKAVDIINTIAEQEPNLIHWAVTRKPEMALKIKPLNNIFLMFSLDNSSRDRLIDNIELMNHPQLYISFMRENVSDNVMNASIIFNAHQNKKNLPFDDPQRCCPVDAGVLPTKNGCENCKKCFSSSILERKRRLDE